MNRDHALAALRRLRQPLLARGIAHASLFGSIARGRARENSDIDVVVTPVVGARLDLIDLGGVQTLLDESFGRDVDVVVEPVRKADLRAAIEQDRIDAF
jgi:predicted nucleotidyltransferase